MWRCYRNNFSKCYYTTCFTKHLRRDNAVFTAAATGSGLTYQLQEDSGSGFTNINKGSSNSGECSNANHRQKLQQEWAGINTSVLFQVQYV